MRPIELDEVMEVLKQENATEIFVIDVSQKCSWTNYLITALGQSGRHSKAVCDALEEKFGHRVRSQSDLTGRVEPGGECEWVVYDAGKLHISMFTKEGRDYYDLEKLWAMKHSLGLSDALAEEDILESAGDPLEEEGEKLKRNKSQKKDAPRAGKKKRRGKK